MVICLRKIYPYLEFSVGVLVSAASRKKKNVWYVPPVYFAYYYSGGVDNPSLAMAVQVALLTILYKLARFRKEGKIGKLRCEIEFVVRLRKWKRFSLVRCESTASLIGMLVPADRLTVESRDEFPIIPF